MSSSLVAFTLPEGTTIDPLQDEVLCRMYEMGEKISENSMIVMPGTSKEEIFIAHVDKVGPGKLNELTGEPMPMCVEPGQDVLFSRYHGERIRMGDSIYLILRHDDLRARLDLTSALEKGFIHWMVHGPSLNALEAAARIEGAG